MLCPQTALRLATCLTLPAVILRSCTMHTDAALGPCVAAAAAGAVCIAAQAASNWIFCAAKPKRERAVIAGEEKGREMA